MLATHRPDLELTLLEARQRACRFLREAVTGLGLAGVTVLEARAEEAAHRPALRGAYEAVVARSFGPPPVSAECAVGFLRVGGSLIVSEPPGDLHRERWPTAGLEALGFGPAVRHGAPEATFVSMEKLRSDDRWPRRTGVPAKRPLWS